MKSNSKKQLMKKNDDKRNPTKEGKQMTSKYAKTKKGDAIDDKDCSAQVAKQTSIIRNHLYK